jgi:hypothetical protein
MMGDRNENEGRDGMTDAGRPRSEKSCALLPSPSLNAGAAT